MLSLGDFAISDFLESADAFTDRAPLVLVRCEDCALVQLRHTVDRERLYRNYWYRSGTQPAMVRALRDVVADARARVELKDGDRVIDIGANDGTLIRQYPTGLTCIAYEPALNLWPALYHDSKPYAGRGVAEVRRYFPDDLRGANAKVITSIACFYDTDDPSAWVQGIKDNLASDGVWINQLAYLPDTLATGNFGDVCHEHLTYWTIQSFNALLKRHGLALLNWAHNDVNGGSIRFIVGHDTGQADLAVEHPDTCPPEAFKHLGQRMYQQREDMVCWLRAARRQGAKVIGYGASTKGNTYLQYWSVGPDLLPMIADRNPDKYGKYTPTGQLVISEAEARDMQPDFFLMLPFHFKEAFVERERLFLESGGQFVIPFPELHFVGGDSLADLQPEATVPDHRAAV